MQFDQSKQERARYEAWIRKQNLIRFDNALGNDEMPNRLLYDVEYAVEQAERMAGCDLSSFALSKEDQRAYDEYISQHAFYPSGEVVAYYTSQCEEFQLMVQTKLKQRQVVNTVSQVKELQLVKPGGYELSDIPPIEMSFIMKCFAESEYGDAQLFAHLFRGKCVFDHLEAKWYIWQGHYWKVDAEKQVTHLICGVLASTYIRASAELNLTASRSKKNSSEDDISEEEEREKVAAIQRKVKALQSRASSLRNTKRLHDVSSLASSFLAMTGNKWDASPWILATAQGTIDLRTGFMRDGKPEEYVRTIVPTEWKGLGEAENIPTFKWFLNDIFNDEHLPGVGRTEQERKELIAFLQRALGYGLLGAVYVHIFLFLFGDEGRNGKDTLVTFINNVLGDCVGAISNDVFLSSGKTPNPGAAKPHLMPLQGKRIAWGSEPDKGARFDVGQVKYLTGGGSIVGRNLYDKGDRTFSPSHLLLLLSNHKPHADASDKAFWERICPIVFNMRYVDDPHGPRERKADTSLMAALEAEKSGFLAWLVQGCLQWQEVGLNIPESIIRERKKYRSEEDTLGIFLTEFCVKEKDARVGCGALYTKYSEWCKIGNMKPLSLPAFGKEIQKTYERSNRTSSGHYYIGIRLLEEGEVPAEQKEKDSNPDVRLMDALREKLAPYLTQPGEIVFVIPSSDGTQEELNAARTLGTLQQAFDGSEADKQWARDSINYAWPELKEQ